MKCSLCGHSMENVEPDPSKAPQRECMNSRCLNSKWHKNTTCPKCGKRPAEITNGGTGFTEFLCEDGHRFTTVPTH